MQKYDNYAYMHMQAYMTHLRRDARTKIRRLNDTLKNWESCAMMILANFRMLNLNLLQQAIQC